MNYFTVIKAIIIQKHLYDKNMAERPPLGAPQGPLRFYEVSFTDFKIERVPYSDILLEDTLDVVVYPKNLQKNFE